MKMKAPTANGSEPIDWVDEAGKQSFPASDPPPWTSFIARSPNHLEDASGTPRVAKGRVQTKREVRKGTARWVVGLMSGIFCFGLFMCLSAITSVFSAAQ